MIIIDYDYFPLKLHIITKQTFPGSFPYTILSGHNIPDEQLQRKHFD